MDDLHISLSGSQQAFVEEQATSGGFPSVNDYVAKLIRAEQKAQAQAKLEALLEEGLNSGPAREWTEEDWERLRRRATGS